ncbi:MAG TPA: aldo/keto reductase [Vicinamibacterales bacterium]|nr:aldo/keto reductase [Vicinamibacterales bacterium]
MRYRRFGRLGWEVSEIGYGMWGIGSWSGSDDEQSLAALERAVVLGCTFFDTAWAYGDGRSERLLGQVLRRHPDRRLYVATKIPPKNRQWPARAEYPLEEVFPPDHIREFTERSLRNLGVETLDLQQFHVWTDAWARDPRWQRAVEALKSEGLVRGFGISVNRWEPDNVLEALETGLVDSVQVVYNLFDQAPEDRLFPACQRLGIAVIARVPFDEGSLTGTLTPDARWPAGDWRNLYFTPENLRETLARVEEIRRDLPEGMSLPELALRFILHHPAVSTTIPGMRAVRHVEANLAVSDGRPLPEALVTRLRRHRWDRTYVVP